MPTLSELLGTDFVSNKIIATTVSANVSISAIDNRKFFLCNNTSDIYINLPDSTTLTDGFNFRVYPANTGIVYVTCSGSDFIRTGSENRQNFTLFRNAEVIKSSNTVYLIQE